MDATVPCSEPFDFSDADWENVFGSNIIAVEEFPRSEVPGIILTIILNLKLLWHDCSKLGVAVDDSLQQIN